MEKIEGGRLVVEALKKGGIPTVAISAIYSLFLTTPSRGGFFPLLGQNLVSWPFNENSSL